MSKELADRLEQWLKWTILNRQEKQLLNEAIAALRSEPVAWIPVGERLPGPNHPAVLVWCPERINMYTSIRVGECWRYFSGRADYLSEEVTHWMPLPDAPSRETAKPEAEFLAQCSCQDNGKCKHNEQGPLCMQEITVEQVKNFCATVGPKPEAEPALSAEQILAQYDQEIKRGGSTDSIIVRTVQHFTALSSLTARDEVEKMRRRVEMYRDKARGNHEAYLKLYADFVGIEGVSHD